MISLKTNDFVLERIKVQPITNADLEKAKKEFGEKVQNPFGFTEKDLVYGLKGFPMGVVVKMMEEAKLHNDKVEISTLQTHPNGSFPWIDTKDGILFWADIINHHKFDKFFERYPDYKKYNLD